MEHLVQHFTTPSGDKMVIMPISEFLNLSHSEDAEDQAAADAVLKDIKEGKDEFIPLEMAMRLGGGEHPIRIWREYRGLNGKELAASAEISASTLSAIENGKKEAGLRTIKKIAETLNVNIDDLIPL